MNLGSTVQPFWTETSHYTNINWDYPDQEQLWDVNLPSTWAVGQELYVGLEFDTKKEVQNAVKQYLLKVHQTMRVAESKSNKYIVNCPKTGTDFPCPFYMRAIQSKRTDRWKVTQWGGPHTCLNTSLTQDHQNLDSHLICVSILGNNVLFVSKILFWLRSFGN